jgi:hypothetical protein
MNKVALQGESVFSKSINVLKYREIEKKIVGCDQKFQLAIP